MAKQISLADLYALMNRQKRVRRFFLMPTAEEILAAGRPSCKECYYFYYSPGYRVARESASLTGRVRLNEL